MRCQWIFLFLEYAFTLFCREENPVGEFLSWCGVVESYIHERSDFTPLDHWLPVAGELLLRHGGFPSREIEVRVSLNMLSALLYRKPHHTEMAVWEERLQKALPKVSDNRLRLLMASSLLLYYLRTGEISKSSLLLEESRPDPAIKAVEPLAYFNWKICEAAYFWETAEFTASMELCTATREETRSAGIHQLDFMILTVNAYSILNTGDTGAGRNILQQLKAVLHPARRLDAAHYHCMAGWECLLRDDVVHAHQHASTGLALSREAGAPWPRGLNLIALAHAHIGSAEFDKALDCLQEARQIAETMKSFLLQFTALLGEARLGLEQADDQQCLTALRAAFAIGRARGFTTSAVWLPTVMARLCVKSLEAGLEVEYVQDLIRKRKLVPDKAPVHLENWPWPLRIYTLGRFSIVMNGESLHFKGKIQQKPLALLKTLIAFGGRDVPVEKLTDLLWPNVDGDDAHKSFTIALHRLRRLLENDKAIQFHDGKITLDARQCWLDTWAFERFCGEVAHASKCTSPENPALGAASVMQRTMHLYNGHFLSGDASSHWAISMRERLKLKALRLIGTCGSYHETCEEWQTAADYYMKGLDIDDHVEEFHQRLMMCQYRMGRTGEALAAFVRCRKVLASIGGKPSLKTLSMNRALLDACDPDC